MAFTVTEKYLGRISVIMFCFHDGIVLCKEFRW